MAMADVQLSTSLNHLTLLFIYVGIERPPSDHVFDFWSGMLTSQSHLTLECLALSVGTADRE